MKSGKIGSSVNVKVSTDFYNTQENTIAREGWKPFARHHIGMIVALSPGCDDFSIRPLRHIPLYKRHYTYERA